MSPNAGPVALARSRDDGRWVAVGRVRGTHDPTILLRATGRNIEARSGRSESPTLFVACRGRPQTGWSSAQLNGVVTVSVLVTIRVPVSDVAKAIEGLQSNAKFLEEISASVKSAGMLHHRFVAGEGELMVVDEWETAEQFQSFFDGNPQVAEVMGSIGMSGPPEVSVFASIDAAGTV